MSEQIRALASLAVTLADEAISYTADWDPYGEGVPEHLARQLREAEDALAAAQEVGR